MFEILFWEVEEAYDIKFFLMLYYKYVLDGPLLLSKV